MDYAKAAKWYHKAAQQGLAEAQDNLGSLYEAGDGVEQSYEKAVKWYRKAAQRGSAHAFYNLCNCYANGLGVKQSNEKAEEYFRNAIALETGAAYAALRQLLFSK